MMIKTIYVVNYLLPFLCKAACETFDREEDMKVFVRQSKAFISSSIHITAIYEIKIDEADDCRIVSMKTLGSYYIR